MSDELTPVAGWFAADVTTISIDAQQLPASIVQQLDELPLDQIDGLGRVRLGGVDTRTGRRIEHVIGRSSDQTMVIAELQPPDEEAARRIDTAPGPVRVCFREQSQYRRGYVETPTRSGRPVALRCDDPRLSICDGCGSEYRDAPHEGGLLSEPTSAALDDLLDANAVVYAQLLARYTAACRLPLVVLT